MLLPGVGAQGGDAAAVVDATNRIVLPGFIAIKLPDLRKVRELIAYDEQGRVVYHGKAKTNITNGLDFTPIRSK